MNPKPLHVIAAEVEALQRGMEAIKAAQRPAGHATLARNAICASGRLGVALAEIHNAGSSAWAIQEAVRNGEVDGAWLAEKIGACLVNLGRANDALRVGVAHLEDYASSPDSAPQQEPT